MGDEKESSRVFENLLFPKVFHTFRIAIYRNNLIIAFMAIVVICLAGWLMDFSNTVVAKIGPKGEVLETELQVYMINPEYVEPYKKRAGENAGHTGVFSTLWHFASQRYHSVLNCLFKFDLPGVAANMRDYFKAVGWAFREHTVYCIIFAIIKLVVISIAGGAICRIAALQFAQDEKPGLTESLRFSINKFASFVTSPLVPLAFIAVIGVFILILGLIGSIPVAGELIMGIFMFLALSAGALITVVLIGAVAGFNLMFPAVAYDGSDCFDAISRSFSYVYAKPWRMGFYTIIAAVYGSICYLFVRFFAFLLLWVTHLLLQFGVYGDNKKLTVLWSRPTFMNLCDPPDWAATNWSQAVAGVIIYLFLLAVVLLVVSFIISFYFSANTIIYSLMRKKVDNTALDDVYSPFEEVDTEPMVTEPEPTVFEQEDTEPQVTEPEPTVSEQDDTGPPVTEPEPEEVKPKAKKKRKKKSEPEAESDTSSSEEQEN